MTDDLVTIVERLELAATQLRAGALDAERAATLVDDCARLAAQAGGELDRRIRSGDQPLGPAQLALGA